MKIAAAALEARAGTSYSRPSRAWVRIGHSLPGRYLPAWPTKKTRIAPGSGTGGPEKNAPHPPGRGAGRAEVGQDRPPAQEAGVDPGEHGHGGERHGREAEL